MTCMKKIGHSAELYKSWWGRIGQALTIYREDNKVRLLDYYKKEVPVSANASPS